MVSDKHGRNGSAGCLGVLFNNGDIEVGVSCCTLKRLRVRRLQASGGTRISASTVGVGVGSVSRRASVKVGVT
jgi:hypothetical protein